MVFQVKPLITVIVFLPLVTAFLLRIKKGTKLKGSSFFHLSLYEACSVWTSRLMPKIAIRSQVNSLSFFFSFTWSASPLSTPHSKPGGGRERVGDKTHYHRGLLTYTTTQLKRCTLGPLCVPKGPGWVKHTHFSCWVSSPDVCYVTPVQNKSQKKKVWYVNQLRLGNMRWRFRCCLAEQHSVPYSETPSHLWAHLNLLQSSWGPTVTVTTH